VADEIARILREDSVRDRKTGVPRRAVAGDIGVLFRSRASHREFERELERRGIATYVYKGLGFFDADETKDSMALIRFLADPVSDLRAAAFLRSRFIRLSDAALAASRRGWPTRPGADETFPGRIAALSEGTRVPSWRGTMPAAVA
jgi:ATP-dependent exoDNAse (exonuclease V) beta subunit